MRENEEFAAFQIFILRCWMERGDQTVTWRCVPENSITGRRVGVAKLSQLAEIIEKQLTGEGPAGIRSPEGTGSPDSG